MPAGAAMNHTVESRFSEESWFSEPHTTNHSLLLLSKITVYLVKNLNFVKFYMLTKN